MPNRAQQIIAGLKAHGQARIERTFAWLQHNRQLTAERSLQGENRVYGGNRGRG